MWTGWQTSASWGPLGGGLSWATKTAELLKEAQQGCPVLRAPEESQTVGVSQHTGFGVVQPTTRASRGSLHGSWCL